MANMRSYRNRCANEGEMKVFDFFKDNLPDDHIVWSNVNLITKADNGINEAEVDFILHHPKVGLMMFEVKDWRADQIKKVSRDGVYVGGNLKRYANPYDHTKNKSYTIKTRMEGYKDLLTRDGRLKTPINVAVIFPYISRKEWDNTLTLLDVIDSYSCGLPTEKILFKEDISPGGTSSSSKACLDMVKRLRAVHLRFPSKLEGKDLDLLDKLLGKPEGKKSLYEGASSTDKILADKKLIILDEKQKEKADQFLKMVNTSLGHLTIKGIAGGGKTVILLRLFSLLARDPDARIAYIGRQKELVDAFKENLKDLGIDPESSFYAVETFHNFFQKTFPVNKNPDMGKSNNGYPNETELTDFLHRHWEDIPEEYDFMFIDEGHNLPDEWIKMLVLSTQGKEHGSLVYVEDFEQNIYEIKRDAAAALLGERREELTRNYRNTIEIQNFATILTDKDKRVKIVDEKKYTRHGPQPETIYSDSRSKTAETLAKKVEKWLKKENVSPEEIAVIYPSSEERDNADSMVNSVVREFKMKNIKLLSHYRTGERILEKFPLHNDTIIPGWAESERVKFPPLSANFITAHSSQGRTYRCVAVIMDNFEMEERWSKAQTNNLMYIALTRATYELVLVFGSLADKNCSKAQVLLK